MPQSSAIEFSLYKFTENLVNHERLTNGIVTKGITYLVITN